MIELKDDISLHLKPVDVLSKEGVFISRCSRKAIAVLAKKKLVVVVNYKPFTVQMNCEYKNQIEEAESLVKEQTKEREEAQKKYQKSFYSNIKLIGKKKAPRKGRKLRTKEQIKKTNKFFHLPTKQKAVRQYTNKQREKIDDYVFAVKESGSLTKDEINKIGEKQDWCCFYCTTDVKNKYSKDHYTPIYLGGLTNKKNVVLCCKSCNNIKGKKNPLDFYKYVLLYGIKGYIYENSLFFKRIRKEQEKPKKIKSKKKII